MKSITIHGIAIQADCLGKGDKAEADQLINAINEAIGGLNSNPQVLGAGSLMQRQIEVVEEEDTP